MTGSVLLVRVTVVLAVGCVALVSFQRISAAAKHGLCLMTLLMTLGLPFLPALAWFDGSSTRYFFARISQAMVGSPPAMVHWWGMIWWTGSVAVGSRFLLGMVYFAWHTRQRQPMEGSFSQEISISLTDVSMPVLWGWLCPVILVPRDFPSWSEEHQRLAVLHELAHLRRADPWTQLLALLARAIYWFHPLVWWIVAQQKEYQERACDEQVLARGIPPTEYAELLLLLANQHTSAPAFICTIASHQGPLRRRIERILHFRPISSRRNRLAVVFGASLLGMASTLIPTSADASFPCRRTVYTVGREVTPPFLLTKREPHYTESAFHRKVQGGVLLEMIVDTDGKARDIRVLHSLDNGLDRQAEEAIQAWRFQSARKGGRPVPVWAKVEVNFRLH